jgi:putative nucleotidyltransferase with HDIG domain
MSVDLKRALYNIAALLDLGEAVTSSEAFSTRIQSILYVVMGALLAPRGAIFLYDSNKNSLAAATSKGFDPADIPLLSVTATDFDSMKKNEPYPLPADNGAIPPFAPMNALQLAEAAVFIPLWARDEFMGSLVLSGKFNAEPYTAEDFDIMRLFARQVAVTLHNRALFLRLAEQRDKNKNLYEEMRRIYHDTIQAFATAIDAKDAYTKNHSQRVARYAVAIARELGMDEVYIEGIYVAGYLHDVGKIIISNEVLNKDGALTEQEMQEMKSHPNLSFEIISKINFPWQDVVTMVRHHHERSDGRGYPDALSEEELSDGAKILILADAFDAMTSDRPYRKKMSLCNSLEEMRRCLGSQFTPRIFAAFCKVLEKEIKGELPEPGIVPHLNEDFDPSIISSLLEALILELSDC